MPRERDDARANGRSIQKIPPVLRASDITASILDDMLDASHVYFNEYGYTFAFEQLLTDSGSSRLLTALMKGNADTGTSLKCLREVLLGRW